MEANPSVQKILDQSDYQVIADLLLHGLDADEADLPVCGLTPSISSHGWEGELALPDLLVDFSDECLGAAVLFCDAAPVFLAGQPVAPRLVGGFDVVGGDD